MRNLLFIILGCCFLFGSCKKGFEAINYGKDACAHCKMTIMDDRYASELVTAKGRAYKFDDVLCMKQYMVEEQVQNNKMLFVEDYRRSLTEPLDATKAVYLKHEFFTSPMNGNYAAFANEADARRLMDSLNVRALSWENLK